MVKKFERASLAARGFALRHPLTPVKGAAIGNPPMKLVPLVIAIAATAGAIALVAASPSHALAQVAVTIAR